MTKQKKTLIILTPGFAANEADTTCLPFLQSHVIALRDSFPELEIIILAFQYPYVKGTYRWNNIEVISFNGRERAKMNRLRTWLQVWRRLLSLNKEKEIIGLFSLWCTECALIGSYFGRLYHLKHHTWLCGQDAKTGNKYVRLMRPKAGELIAMSDFLKKEFYKNYGLAPTHVIPIGVVPEQFSSGQSPRDIDVLGAGSLIPLKQYDVFVNVIHELTGSMPSINAMICGKGPEEKKLIGLVTQLQLQGNITLAGEVQHADVLQLMQRCRIFLHTSNYEGFGTVCLEALCAGAHVVSFTRPMDIDIPHWHHVSSKEEMAAKMQELLLDKHLANTAVTPYTSAATAKTIMKLFSST